MRVDMCKNLINITTEPKKQNKKTCHDPFKPADEARLLNKLCDIRVSLQQQHQQIESALLWLWRLSYCINIV